MEETKETDKAEREKTGSIGTEVPTSKGKGENQRDDYIFNKLAHIPLLSVVSPHFSGGVSCKSLEDFFLFKFYLFFSPISSDCCPKSMC